MSIFEELIDDKILKIFRVISKDKGYFHLQKISRLSKVPMSTTFRIVNKLLRLGLLEQIKVDKTKLYKIAENEKTKELKEVLR